MAGIDPTVILMTTNSEIKPSTIDVPQADLDDLNERLARTRWPAQLPGEDWSRGAPVPYLKELVEYWRTAYDWRAYEAELNSYPQFTTEIDGQTIHFLHVRSPEPDALPLIVTHSWPLSIVEFMKVLRPLTDPRAHGGDPKQAFHVVAPSVPGFGFSSAPSDTDWDMPRLARIWAEVMRRLGYDRYGVSGNDFGAVLAPEVALVDTDHVAGVHITAGLGVPTGAPGELDVLTAEERAGIPTFTSGEGPFHHVEIQSKRPQTLAYGFHDSPVFQLAWIVERFHDWTDYRRELPEDAVERDLMLTNITLYWLSGSAGSSTWWYSIGAARMPVDQKVVPTGLMSATPGMRRLAERGNDIVHVGDHDFAGHFTALEVPEMLVADLREFFAKVR
ncbi:epoxide hydrolase [Flindersiella endophytica]